MMVLLYLTAVVFGGVIFTTFLILDTMIDRRARVRAEKRLGPTEKGEFRSRKDPFLAVLQMVEAPEFFDRWVDGRDVVQSGIDLDARQFKALWWILVLGGTCLGVTGFLAGLAGIGWVTLEISLVLLTMIGPYLFLLWRIKKRERAVTRELPDFLDMLTFTIDAGLGFVPALRRVSKGYTGIFGEEIKQVLVQIELGFSRHEALEDLASRLPSADVEQLVEAINLSEQLGTSLGRTLRIQANLMRTRRRQRAEVKAQTAPIRIIPALVFFFLPSLLLIYLAPPIINFLFRR